MAGGGGLGSSWMLYQVPFFKGEYRCTIFDNRAADAGGGVSSWESDVTIANCIVWANRDQNLHEVASLNAANVFNLRAAADVLDESQRAPHGRIGRRGCTMKAGPS